MMIVMMMMTTMIIMSMTNTIILITLSQVLWFQSKMMIMLRRGLQCEHTKVANELLKGVLKASSSVEPIKKNISVLSLCKKLSAIEIVFCSPISG